MYGCPSTFGRINDSQITIALTLVKGTFILLSFLENCHNTHHLLVAILVILESCEIPF